MNSFTRLIKNNELMFFFCWEFPHSIGTMLYGVFFFWGDGILVGFKAHPRRALSLPVRGGCQQAAGLPKMGLPQ
jgi:hypothetical protein